MGRPEKYGFAAAAERSGGIVLLLVLVEFVDQLFGVGLDRFGIVPWTSSGLIGVVFAPLLHGGFGHLTANVGPLFVLLIILFWNRRYFPERSILLIWILSGIGTWLIGRQHAVHIGASSIVFGLVSYLIVAAIWMACWRALFFLFWCFCCLGDFSMACFILSKAFRGRDI